MTDEGAGYMLCGDMSRPLSSRLYYATDDMLVEDDMAFDKKKIANSFYLPKHSFLRGLASLLDFTRSEGDEFTEQILARSDAEAMRADWEAVGASMWWAIGEHERRKAEGVSRTQNVSGEQD